MHSIKIIRHAPKVEGDPHHTGIEARLEETAPKDVEAFVEREKAFFEGATKINIFHTPVPRSIQTAEFLHTSLKQHFGNDAVIAEPAMTPMVGSSETQNGQVINLSPKDMSRIWGEAKQNDHYTGTNRREDQPLHAWATVGFDNNWDETGISIREIALRLGTFLYQRFSEEAITEDKIADIGISHSGDIEPFLYLLIAYTEGIDTRGQNAMPALFDRLGGAMNPFEGVEVNRADEDNLEVKHFTISGPQKMKVPMSVLKEMKEELERISIADKVFAQKTAELA